MKSITTEHNGLEPYLAMLERLRTEDFHEETNEKLKNHPYVMAAKEGRLTMAQRRAFICEQFVIQHSDACSFASLAGHVGFHPSSLATAKLPDAKDATNATGDNDIPDLFQFLLGGELYASQLLLDHAKSLGLASEDSIEKSYNVTSRGQAYPSYWARLALNQQHAAAAAACAVNFPAWGSMCKSFLEALQSREEYGYSGKDSKLDLAFIEFFATTIDNLDEMAATIMKREQVSYEDIITTVRLLQEYEILFWDAVFDAKE
jgi:hypothetical protein